MILRIPNSIKIGPYNVPVKLFDEKRETNGEVNLGSFNTVENYEIELWTGMGDEKTSGIFMHEVVEGICEIHGLELNHEQISTIAVALYQVIKDNNLRF